MKAAVATKPRKRGGNGGRRKPDPVTDYAQAVVDGAIITGRAVRQACERHLRNLAQQRTPDFPYWFDVDAAQDVIDFFPTLLTLENGDPFILPNWLQFCYGSLYGWKRQADGLRRFQIAYIETGKGSGKTPSLAGIGLYGLVCDGEQSAEIYSAAFDTEQASIILNDAIRMGANSEDLADVLDIGKYNIAHPESRSYFRAVSSEHRSKSGQRPYLVLVDELHEHRDGTVVNKMIAGFKFRKQPLIVEITNAGFDRTSICWQHHEMSIRVLEQVTADEQWFAYVCHLDPCEACANEGHRQPNDACTACDQWTDPAVWIKANPSLGVVIQPAYLEKQVARALAMPGDEDMVRRLNFCIWTQSYSRAIDMGKWTTCPPMPTDSELRGAEVFGCLDLGETDDFTAWGKLYLLKNGNLAVKMKYYLPEIALERYPNRPYSEWRRAGILTVTPGEVTDYSFVRAQMLADFKAEGLIQVCYDTKTARETAQLLIAEGVDMVPMTQGFALNEAIKRFLAMVVGGQIHHGNDPVLTWMASNLVVLKGTKGELRIAKERAPEKIDGIAALVMGIEGALIRRERKTAPSFQMFTLGRR
jgi:phage terminase large subunit-like protein